MCYDDAMLCDDLLIHTHMLTHMLTRTYSHPWQLKLRVLRRGITNDFRAGAPAFTASRL